MKKIGIITYHHTTNFGSILQTYGLYRKVTEFGYNCEIVNYINAVVEKRERPKKLFDCKNIRAIRDYFKYEHVKKNKDKEFDKFLDENMRVSKKIYDKDNIEEANPVYDIFLVGSDLVWDDTINNCDRNYMLKFVADNKQKIAYASSTGQFWDNDLNEVYSLLNRFKNIGVREKEIYDELNKHLNFEVDFVGDPTILLEPQTWGNLACNRIINEEYVLIYFNDDELKIYEDAINYGKKYGLKVYAISYSWLPKDITPIRPTKIEEFLSLVKNANTVFTASYHGMLYSIYFNKNFFYYNRGWKSRMRSIADYLDLGNREHYDEKVNKDIDYDEVNRRMELLRQKSIACLESYLKD
ncbi:polysaccharide pyruvyl transferase family protein [Pseudobutyrivibrio ruminis]|uniref:polysaccharide pyruvyl transferase family protein n=1 Tax=Pseudobutyrivibrio ruminis TaxID=46206 RepID=UPI00041EA85A|nr:polysaccharide pyruvyl transferase family protein [Pseudobutyrivibrio ruminis]